VQYPHWSKVTHLPLPLKLWLGRAALQYLAVLYLRAEDSLVWKKLIELETSLLEESLPVPQEAMLEEEEEEEGEEVDV
jgi:hypothetical protein